MDRLDFKMTEFLDKFSDKNERVQQIFKIAI